MAVGRSVQLGSAVFVVTTSLVTGLDNRDYLEWRLEERDESGVFVGFAAFGSRDVVETALENRRCDHREHLRARAQTMGAEHGRARASWYFDGNTSEDTYRRVLQGIEEGDPAVYDTFPSGALSGEWADDPTPASVLAELAGTVDYNSVLTYEEQDEILRHYEDAFDVAVSETIEAEARKMVGSDE